MKLLWKSSDFSFYNKYLFRFNNYAASTLSHIFGAKISTIFLIANKIKRNESFLLKKQLEKHILIFIYKIGME